jgi:hypothetical protein
MLLLNLMFLTNPSRGRNWGGVSVDAVCGGQGGFAAMVVGDANVVAI